MGVPKLFNFIKKYNNPEYISVDGTVGTIIKNRLPIPIDYEPITDTYTTLNPNDNLFLDFNGGIYTALNENKCKSNTCKNLDDLDKSEISRLEDYFVHNIMPILTPLASDQTHPFPYISDLSLSVGVFIHSKNMLQKDFVRIKIGE